ncbi:hypothetical protein [Labilibacter marinus]|uniref:hypothetical protein n=1 Tax=Labilibacter marinus TaxID=1477105 RepID=UPI00094FC334|nr:hypothetical protein [Labilibacter marinus]
MTNLKICISILFIAFTLNSNAKKKQDSTWIHYLNEVKLNFDPSCELLKKADVERNQYFFINEDHGYNANHQIALQLLKELKEKSDFSYIMLEGDLMAAHNLNYFLSTGDTVFLKKYIDTGKGLFAWTKENYNYYKAIYHLNKNYKNKLRFIGVDVAFSVQSNIDTIAAIRRKYDLTCDFPIGDKKQNKVNDEQASYAQHILKTNTSKFSIEDAFIHEYCTQNLINYYSCLQSSNWDQTRDSLIFENYKKLTCHYTLSSEKMMGLFGRNHGYQAKESDVDWLASRIKNESQKQVYSIALFYIYGERMIPDHFIPGVLKLFRSKNKLYYNLKITHDYNNYKKGIEQFYAVTNEHSIHSFNLNKTNSPYKEANHLVKPNTKTSSVITTDCFQTAIVFRDPKPATPLGENKKD